MRNSLLRRRTHRFVREIRVTPNILWYGVLSIFFLTDHVGSGSADTARQPAIAAELLDSIKQCLIDCAPDQGPFPDYEQCRENRYRMAMNAENVGSRGLAEWLLLPELVRSNTNLALLAHAAAEIADLQNMHASPSEIC